MTSRPSPTKMRIWRCRYTIISSAQKVRFLRSTTRNCSGKSISTCCLLSAPRCSPSRSFTNDETDVHRHHAFHSRQVDSLLLVNHEHQERRPSHIQAICLVRKYLQSRLPFRQLSLCVDHPKGSALQMGCDSHVNLEHHARYHGCLQELWRAIRCTASSRVCLVSMFSQQIF